LAAKTLLADPIRFNKDEIIFQEGGLIRSYCKSGSNMVQGDYGHLQARFSVAGINDGKLAGADNWPEYSFTADILGYKRRIMIGKEDDLREKAVKTIHNSCIESHARRHNSHGR